MNTQTAGSDGEAIRRIVEAQSTAIGAKDMDALIALYEADAVVFDVKPPFRACGAETWRKIWEACLPYFPSPVEFVRRHLEIIVSGNMAVAHWIWRLDPKPLDERSAKCWIRTTTCLRRAASGWRIFHEHHSLPFDPLTSQVVYALDPDAVTGHNS